MKYSEISKHIKYEICNNKYEMCDMGIDTKICDFDFSSIEGVINNNKVNQEWTDIYHINSSSNKYVDMHLFLHTLLNVEIEYEIPDEIIEFGKRVMPDNITIMFNRIDSQCEHTTPLEVINSDPLFADYLLKKN